LVTGASGNLGHWICRLAVKKWAVTGIHWQHPFSMDGVKSVRADLSDLSVLENLLVAVKPSAVIHTAAVSQMMQCEQHPKATRRINVAAAEKLSALCADLRIPFVFTSTDLVFDGLSAPYAEQDPMNPVCVYGCQKAEAEAAVLNANGNALVCRMPLMIGVGPRAASSFSIQMLFNIRQGRALQLFTDEFRTPVTYRDAARGLLTVIGKACGPLHMGGRFRVSRFDLGLRMAEQMGIAPTMIQPVTLRSLNLGVTRSPDCSLASDKAFALGYDPAPLSKAIQWVVKQFDAISTVSTTRRQSS
jgi:dTDP-4-dehydrorhamnose reductase